MAGKESVGSRPRKPIRDALHGRVSALRSRFDRLTTEQRENPSKEQLVVDTIRRIEVPFLDALQQAYPDSGWRIAGPASIALSRALNSLTGVPIKRGGTDEHIELEIGIFDPKNDPKRGERIAEQPYLKYYNGKGDIYYIDPIYNLFMAGRQQLAGAIQVEKYRADKFDDALMRKHTIYPFDPNHSGLELSVELSRMSPGFRQLFYNDSIASLHDERATLETHIADSGAISRNNWNKTVPVIQAVAPEWQEDKRAIVKRLAEACEVVLAEHSLRTAGRRGSRYVSKEPFRMPPFVIEPDAPFIITPEIRAALAPHKLRPTN